MQYFKDTANNVYAYDEGEEEFILEGLTEITEKEAIAIANPPPTREELIAAAEHERQQLLAHADAVMLDWRTELMLGEISEVNKAKLSAWMAYKYEVKAVDVTINPEHVNWPVSPEV